MVMPAKGASKSAARRSRLAAVTSGRAGGNSNSALPDGGSTHHFDHLRRLKLSDTHVVTSPRAKLVRNKVIAKIEAHELQNDKVKPREECARSMEVCSHNSPPSSSTLQ